MTTCWPSSGGARMTRGSSGAGPSAPAPDAACPPVAATARRSPGPPGAPGREAFRPSRDLAARREAYYGRAARPVRATRRRDRTASRRRRAVPPADAWSVPAPSGVPGERRYQDGQRVRHRIFGEGLVVSSRLTRDDEEVTVAFPDQGVKKLMASLAGLEVRG